MTLVPEKSVQSRNSRIAIGLSNNARRRKKLKPFELNVNDLNQIAGGASIYEVGVAFGRGLRAVVDAISTGMGNTDLQGGLGLGA